MGRKKRWYYYKDNNEITNIHQDETDSFQSIEITYEPDENGDYQYYMNFFVRSAGSDAYAINYPYDVKTRLPGTDRYLLAGGSDNAFIKHGFKLGYLPRARVRRWKRRATNLYKMDIS